MKRRHNLRNIFHVIIIASFILSLSACGHKSQPFYTDDTPKGDENVEFHITKPKKDNKQY